MAEEKFKHIIRIVNTDLDGNISIVRALRKIKGVSFMFSNMACVLSKVDKKKKTGNLSNEEVQRLETFFKDPVAHGAPEWSLNRRKDPYDGASSQILSTDIKFIVDNDLKRLKMIKCYKGVRHMSGLPVRGQ
ncbi:30S ribosomal protein S13, partial [Candidatus Woesearchaeota archaeon]|nr:30S ribosomal protein S13 [Candidatus Woesearchaeota archaeon]